MVKMQEWDRSLNLFKKDKLKSSQFVFMGRPSYVLRESGLSKGRIGISVGKLKIILNKHPEVTFDLLKTLSISINSPKYVLSSSTVENSVSVVVIPIVNDDGRVFVVPIEKNHKALNGETINRITSIYMKDDPKWLSRELDASRLIFDGSSGAA